MYSRGRIDGSIAEPLPGGKAARKHTGNAIEVKSDTEQHAMIEKNLATQKESLHPPIRPSTSRRFDGERCAVMADGEEQATMNKENARMKLDSPMGARGCVTLRAGR